MKGWRDTEKAEQCPLFQFLYRCRR
jgi:hypothetical protein